MATFTPKSKSPMEVAEVDAEFMDSISMSFMDSVNKVFSEAILNSLEVLSKSSAPTWGAQTKS